jgi:hypothetical protein
MAREPSGVAWVERFPTSRSTDALVDGFRQKCEAFLAALEDAGAAVTISATLRPPERAYLMHWSYVITTGAVEPEDVPACPGVDIEWVHRKPDGAPDVDASRAAAAAMVDGYDIAYAPSLTSLHIFGKAIDISVEWDGTLKIKQMNGAEKTIGSLPRSGLNHELWAVGAGYGVLKLASDAPHWSSTGH